jgi:hypothetical protein
MDIYIFIYIDVNGDGAIKSPLHQMMEMDSPDQEILNTTLI